MKQLHNALCHPAATLAQTVETSHYKSHIQAPFTTYGTRVMLASESSRRRTCTPRAATLSHKSLSPQQSLFPQRRGQVPGHGCALIKERSRTMTDQTAKPDPAGSQSSAGGFSRRSLFRAAGVGAAVVGGGSFLEACSSGIKGATSSTGATSTSGATTTKEITIS